jgi:hypothetical protein
MLTKARVLSYSNHLKYGVYHQGTIRDFIEDHSSSKYYYTPPADPPKIISGWTLRQEEADIWRKNRAWIDMLQKMDPERYTKDRLFVSKEEILRLNEEHEEFGLRWYVGGGYSPDDALLWIEQYEKFMGSGCECTPTFEQEFMWRTHLTDHRGYVDHCMKKFGRIIPHKT